MALDNPTIGEITMFAGNFAPRQWAFCDGQLLAISTYQALFSIIGTTYGGDGRTTFALPDLRGRAPIHSGNGSTGPGLSPRPLGQRSGQETVTLTTLEIPSHTHYSQVTQSPGGIASGTINAGANGNTNNPSGKFLAQSGNIGPNQINVYGDDNNVPMASGSVSIDMSNIPAPTVTNTNTGGGQPHNNMQPYLAVNFIIALEGTYPSRN